MRPELIPTYALYGEPADSTGDFRLHCETIASRSERFSWEIKPHRHQTFFQILYFRNGNGDAIFGETEHRIVPQTIITVPPETVHGFRFSHDMDGFVLTCVADRLPSGSAPWQVNFAGLDQPNMFYGNVGSWSRRKVLTKRTRVGSTMLPPTIGRFSFRHSKK